MKVSNHSKKVKFMVAPLIALTLSLLTPASLLAKKDMLQQAPASEIAVRYGDRHEFDVYRKGKKIGESVTRFRQTDKGLLVRTDLKMKVKFLFITAYKLDLKSEELWDGRGVQQISSDIDNNGKDVYISAARSGDDYRWQSFKGEVFEENLPHPFFPTTHWHPAVLTQGTLFNTLTGEMLAANATSQGWETLETADGTIEAERFLYDWELDETESWYDAAGRWVGLRFSAGDGSKITYICRTCGESQS